MKMIVCISIFVTVQCNISPNCTAALHPPLVLISARVLLPL
jgi:hypothetical protein